MAVRRPKVDLRLHAGSGPRADALRALATALEPEFEVRLFERSAYPAEAPDLCVVFDDVAAGEEGVPTLRDLSDLALEEAVRTPGELVEERAQRAAFLISSRRRDLDLLGEGLDLRHAPLPVAGVAGPTPPRTAPTFRLGVLADLRGVGGDFAFACSLARDEAEDVAILDVGAGARERAMALAEVDAVLASFESPMAEAYALEALARGRFVIARSTRVAQELDPDARGVLAISADPAALAAATFWCRRNLDELRALAIDASERVRAHRGAAAVAPLWADIFRSALGLDAPSPRADAGRAATWTGGPALRDAVDALLRRADGPVHWFGPGARADCVAIADVEEIPEHGRAVAVCGAGDVLDRDPLGLADRIAQRCVEAVLAVDGEAAGVPTLGALEQRLLIAGASFRERRPLPDGGCVWRLAFPAPVASRA